MAVTRQHFIAFGPTQREIFLCLIFSTGVLVLIYLSSQPAVPFHLLGRQLLKYPISLAFAEDSPLETLSNATFESISPAYLEGKNDEQLSTVMCPEDKRRIEQVFKPVKSGAESLALNKIVMYPVQLGCRNLVRIGGKWRKRYYDGSKFVCWDDFEDKGNKPCLIYSFGIGPELTFEEIISKKGCIIHAYDHTTKMKYKKGIIIHKLGVGNKTENRFTTLKDAIEANGNSGQDIIYLKADIEGAEQHVIPDWVNSGVLKHVKQIGMEFHNYNDPTVNNSLVFLNLVRLLYKQGFKLISYDPNLASRWATEHFQPLFEVLFRKVQVCGL